MARKKIKPAYLILLLLIVTYVVVGLLMKHSREDSLNKNSDETKAVVTEFYSISFSFYYKYDFEANGIKYEGSGRRNQDSDEIAIGDTILIEYDRLDPTNNRPIAIHSY